MTMASVKTIDYEMGVCVTGSTPCLHLHIVSRIRNRQIICPIDTGPEQHVIPGPVGLVTVGTHEDKVCCRLIILLVGGLLIPDAGAFAIP